MSQGSLWIDQGHLRRSASALQLAGISYPSQVCRKDTLFYRTLQRAAVGDLYMSLIHTCELNKVSAFEYLVALLQHPDAIAKKPAAWMPWNYRQAP